MAELKIPIPSPTPTAVPKAGTATNPTTPILTPEEYFDKLNNSKAVGNFVINGETTTPSKDNPNVIETSYSGSPIVENNPIVDLAGYNLNRGLKDFNQYDNNITPSMNGYDQQRARAINQPLGRKVVNTIANILPNMALGIIEGVGLLAELPMMAVDKTDRDFSNALTRWTKEQKNMFGENYKYNPEVEYDVSDPAFWLEFGGSIVESVGSFAALGAGMGGAALKGAKTIAPLLTKSLGKMGAGAKVIQGAEQAVNAGAQLSTAIGLGYTEGAISGSSVYKDIGEKLATKNVQELYNMALEEEVQRLEDEAASSGEINIKPSKGILIENAKRNLGGLDQWDKTNKDAFIKKQQAEGAVATVQLNTALMTMLSIPTLNTFFKAGTNSLKEVGELGLKRGATEARKDWITRLKDSAQFTKLDKNIQKKILAEETLLGAPMSTGAILTREGVNEGFEELVNVHSEKTGKKIGTTGLRNDLTTLFAQSENFAENTMNEEGFWAFLGGAVGGIGQKGALDNIPVFKSVKNDKGEIIDSKLSPNIFSKDNVSAKGLRNQQIQQQYEAARTNLINNVEKFDMNLNSLKDLQIKKREKEVTAPYTAQEQMEHDNKVLRLKTDIFAQNMTLGSQVTPNAFDAFENDYKEIANYDNKDVGKLAKPLQEDYDKLTQQLQEANASGNAEAVQAIQAQQQELKKEIVKREGVTEAQFYGLATDEKDNSYKTDAQIAIKNIQYAKDIHKKYKALYNDPRAVESGYVDELFYTDLRHHTVKGMREELENKTENRGDNPILVDENIKRLGLDIEPEKTAELITKIRAIDNQVEEFKKKKIEVPQSVQDRKNRYEQELLSMIPPLAQSNLAKSFVRMRKANPNSTEDYTELDKLADAIGNDKASIDAFEKQIIAQTEMGIWNDFKVANKADKNTVNAIVKDTELTGNYTHNADVAHERVRELYQAESIKTVEENLAAKLDKLKKYENREEYFAQHDELKKVFNEEIEKKKAEEKAKKDAEVVASLKKQKEDAEKDKKTKADEKARRATEERMKAEAEAVAKKTATSKTPMSKTEPETEKDVPKPPPATEDNARRAGMLQELDDISSKVLDLLNDASTHQSLNNPAARDYSTKAAFPFSMAADRTNNQELAKLGKQLEQKFDVLYDNEDEDNEDNPFLQAKKDEIDANLKAQLKAIYDKLDQNDTINNTNPDVPPVSPIEGGLGVKPKLKNAEGNTSYRQPMTPHVREDYPFNNGTNPDYITTFAKGGELKVVRSPKDGNQDRFTIFLGGEEMGTVVGVPETIDQLNALISANNKERNNYIEQEYNAGTFAGEEIDEGRNYTLETHPNKNWKQGQSNFEGSSTANPVVIVPKEVPTEKEIVSETAKNFNEILFSADNAWYSEIDKENNPKYTASNLVATNTGKEVLNENQEITIANDNVNVAYNTGKAKVGDTLTFTFVTEKDVKDPSKVFKDNGTKERLKASNELKNIAGADKIVDILFAPVRITLDGFGVDNQEDAFGYMHTPAWSVRFKEGDEITPDKFVTDKEAKNMYYDEAKKVTWFDYLTQERDKLRGELSELNSLAAVNKIMPLVARFTNKNGDAITKIEDIELSQQVDFYRNALQRLKLNLNKELTAKVSGRGKGHLRTTSETRTLQEAFSNDKGTDIQGLGIVTGRVADTITNIANFDGKKETKNRVADKVKEVFETTPSLIEQAEAGVFMLVPVSGENEVAMVFAHTDNMSKNKDLLDKIVTQIQALLGTYNKKNEEAAHKLIDMITFKGTSKIKLIHTGTKETKEFIFGLSIETEDGGTQKFYGKDQKLITKDQLSYALGNSKFNLTRMLVQNIDKMAFGTKANGVSNKELALGFLRTNVIGREIGGQKIYVDNPYVLFQMNEQKGEDKKETDQTSDIPVKKKKEVLVGKKIIKEVTLDSPPAYTKDEKVTEKIEGCKK